ncbi:MAG: thioredoxin family protein [Patescibacteria group bacterium]
MKIWIILSLVIGFLLAGGIYLEIKNKNRLLSFNDYFLERKDVMTKTEQVKLSNFGRAPAFTGLKEWFNSEELKLQDLKGKVVLVDFWTYSCINCIRTLPHVTALYEKYKDQGLVIVGIHTPEFAFEKEPANVAAALQRYNITYPVALDNDYATWQAYANRYWPAKYLVDQSGKIVYTHFGEGQYQETEQAVRQLLGLTEEMADKPRLDLQDRQVKTPEIYFGLNRLAYLFKEQQADASSKFYDLPDELPVNNFALGGQWSFNDESAVLQAIGGRIKITFFAKEIHMVAKSPKPNLIKIKINGRPVNDVEVSDSRLYTLFSGDQAGENTLEMEISQPDFTIYTFTFG